VGHQDPRSDPERRRRSIRLRGHDYALPGAYFITICTQGRRHLLGQVDGGRLHASAGGIMVADWWARLPDKFPSLGLDAFVVMPNHIHGIILFGEGAHAGAPLHGDGGGSIGGNDAGDAVGADPRVRPRGDVAPNDTRQADPRVRPQRPDAPQTPPKRPPTLGAVVQWFKTMTTNGLR
jgi:putative transposase